ncbi:MAG: methyltransferase domain-containing protein [Chloroflexi bacterium]|nr:methyltransferase domain-containing protein [Chloroflexota bacterium]
MQYQTTVTQSRYDRIAPFYDLMEWFTERARFQEWRQLLWSRIPAGPVLEVGVGTGKNMPFYPPDAQITAVDLSERMLQRATNRARELGLNVDLRQMDAQQLEFPDDSFDAVVTTFVFCSVPDPVQGLRELGRVVKPDGDIWLLEHVRVNRPIIGPLMDALNPVVVRIVGANINRQTVENVRRAGLEIVDVENLRGDLVKLIHARPAKSEVG